MSIPDKIYMSKKFIEEQGDGFGIKWNDDDNAYHHIVKRPPEEKPRFDTLIIGCFEDGTQFPMKYNTKGFATYELELPIDPEDTEDKMSGWYYLPKLD